MAKVLKTFVDKLTKRLYSAGDTYEGDRTEYLQELGFVEGAAEKGLEDMTKAELEKYAKEHEVEGVTTTMTKAEMIEAIKAVI